MTFRQCQSVTRAAVVFGFLVGPSLFAQTQAPAPARTPQERFAPFTVIGNIHYVGSTNAGAFLVTTAEGHILIDTGYPRTESWVRESIEKLGFKVADIKLILNTHAHSDHVGGHAQFKEWTGAKVLTSKADAPVLADGGRSDFRGDGSELWKPLKADGVVSDGEAVRLGGMTLVAHLTPGHTRGNTTWTTTVEEDGRKLDVVFVGSMGPTGVPLVGNAKYPQIAEDYARSFKVLKKLPCDVFLAFHADHFNLVEKKRQLDSGRKPNPFIGPEELRAYLAKNEALFRAQLEKERVTK
jgi:metallo-beta-lactamase class B